MRLKDKVAVVTGAGRGMGEAFARRLSADGAHILVSDLDGGNAETVATSIRDAGGVAVAVAADVSSEKDVEAMFATAISSFGTVDILVNNAGISTNKLFVETTRADMERIIGVNLIGAFLCSQAALAIMRPKGRGRIVNIASLSGQRGGVGRTAYGVSKAGIEMMTRVMSVELAAEGITINNVAPGAIATQMAVEQHDEATRDAYHYLIPQRRYGTPEEVADAVAFLASDEARHVCGITLNVDGGFATAGLMYEREGVAHAKLPKVATS